MSDEKSNLSDLPDAQIWLERERQSPKARLISQKLVPLLWQKLVVNSRLTAQERISKLQILRNFLANCLPANYSGTREQYAMWLKQNFALAIENQDYEHFATLFHPLSLNDLRLINTGESLGLTIPDKLPAISSKSIKLLQKYLNDVGYSATISISNVNGESYTLPSRGNNPDSAFSMHSVGKVFTGTLMLLAVRKGYITETDLNRPIQLAPSVREKLSKDVQQRLTQVTLKQIMLHESGLKDYLDKYCDAIRAAISSNTPVPEIRTCHDFLRFADVDVGLPHYSNLGILLVGLAIEHAYQFKTGEEKPYEELLQELIIKPAGMNVFTTHRPNNGQFNTDDVVTQHIVASPAGGYWTTVEELQRFGSWVNRIFRKDPELLRLLEIYGGEFYSAKTGEIAHNGALPSASAYLITSLESGTTVAVLSDQGNVAPKLCLTIIEQSLLDNNALSMKSVALNNLGFFRSHEKEFLKKHRHDSPELQQEYDKRFGLIVRN